MIPAILFVLALLLPGPAFVHAAPGPMPGIDANSATAAELDAINGIGPALAARIIEERRKSPFQGPEDFARRVRGVGPASLRRMQEGGLVVRSPAGGAVTHVGGSATPQASRVAPASQAAPESPVRRVPPSRP